MRRIFFALITAAMSLPDAASAASGCPAGTILVGEDADNYYCKDRHEFSQCVRAAGEQLVQMKPICAKVAGDCFREHQVSLSASALACVLGCGHGRFRSQACIASCAPALLQAEWIYDGCLDKGYSCFD